MKKFIIIDAHALIHRAFHALPPLTTKQGEPIGAVYGFAALLLKILREMKPDYVVAAFDLPKPTFRHLEFKEYKATRARTPADLETQFAPSREILLALAIPILEKEGYEADDVIGSLSESLRRRKNALEINILTGDLDTLQLVAPHVKVYTLRKGMSDITVYGETEVRARFGGLRPHQLIDFKGLKGDPSDNIPGAPGIGEKTAIQLIQQFGNIETLYKKIDDPRLTPRLRNVLLEAKDVVMFSKHLSTIAKDLVFPINLKNWDWKRNYEPREAEGVFQKYGFYTLLQRLPKTTDEAGGGAPQRISSDTKPQRGNGKEEHQIKNKNDLEKFLRRAQGGRWVSFALTRQSGGEEGVLEMGVDEERFVWNFSTGNIRSIEPFLDFLNTPTPSKYVYDVKSMLSLVCRAVPSEDIRNIHWDTSSWFDVLIAFYLLNPGRRTYEWERILFEELGPAFKDTSRGEALRHLAQNLKQKLVSQGVESVFRQIEMPLIPVLYEMEKMGIKVDGQRLKKISQTISRLVRDLETNIYGLAGESFNINSPKQLSHILFEKLHVPPTSLRKTPGGALSTSEDSLSLIREGFPIVDLILKVREYTKLKTTYTDAFPPMLHPKTKRLHTHFNQTGTATGRLSSYEPNVQNIPIRSELGSKIRSAFRAEDGYRFVSFDYSQMELRVAAALSGDKKLLHVFEKGEDAHRSTAAELYHLDTEDITPKMRDHAKTLNFGIIYGISASRFAKSAGIPLPEAKDFIKRYRQAFPELSRYLELCKESARRDGYVKTFFGRRRFLPEIHSSAPELVRQAERMAANMPIQGTAADIIKRAMVALSRSIHERGVQNEVRLLLQIHDELLFEITHSIVEKEVPLIRDFMKKASPFSVPFDIDVKVGDTWGSMIVWNM